ncbi:YjjW family glycine radical enzyme activase [Photobacterium leiognathi]|uniref:YjjW family glycine radical enzyme activase n=1 Tax=Photobacterium leiognathi TaxID=553611 RepID=UPI0029822D45|nr:YjjW family glycine radical enzyme activase [Photobacterium leiognathi]
MISASISKILNFSCVDGPGNRMVIFFQGCNYNCKNCHNPQTIGVCNHCTACVEHCPTQALQTEYIDNKPKVIWNKAACTECDKCIEVCPKQASPKTESISVSQLIEKIQDNRLFINGITVSGGEASLHLPFIIALFRLVKTTASLKHLTCMIDSNGSLGTTGWKHLLPYLDGAMIDLKAWHDETHHWLTNRSNHRVFETMNFLHSHNKLHEIRLLHIPDKTDFIEHIEQVSRFLRPFSDSVTIKLNAFRHHGVTGEALNWDECSKEEIDHFHTELAQRGVQNIVLPAMY